METKRGRGDEERDAREEHHEQLRQEEVKKHDGDDEDAQREAEAIFPVQSCIAPHSVPGRCGHTQVSNLQCKPDNRARSSRALGRS